MPTRRVTFTSLEGVSPEPQPLPAKKMIPNWYKSMSREMDVGENTFHMGTVKKCSPFHDAITLGYFVRLPSAIRVVFEENRLYFSWRNSQGREINRIEVHPPEQSGPIFGDVWKFMLDWGVKLPDGYSALWTHPLNRHDLPFRTLSGVVDKGYDSPINIPFVWVSEEKETVLDRGLPIAQVIPFRREKWLAAYESIPNSKLMNATHEAANSIDGYRRKFRRRKIYR